MSTLRIDRRTIFGETEQRSPIALPLGTVLHGQYQVGRILGRLGGFGITYLCWDTALDIPVAIKEYLPRHLAQRGVDRKQVVADSDDSSLFKFGLQEFIGEARIVAGFSHPNIVRVRTYFQENSTAYLVMDYYEGTTLEAYARQRGGRLPEREATAILMLILDALRTEVHPKPCLHRDVKPQNIYLTRERVPILLDFGAARVSLGARSGSVNTVLTPGYAPFEQYLSEGERQGKRFREGPWTDVYGAAATLYRLVTGRQPPAATDRQGGVALEPPNRLAPGLSPAFSKALVQGMALEPAKRPATVAAFQRQLRKKSRVDPRALAPWLAAAALLVLLFGLYQTLGPGLVGNRPNQPPQALSDVVAIGARERAEIPVLMNDFDPDEDPLMLASVERPRNGAVSWTEDGSIIYTPNQGFTGEETFHYEVTDGHSVVQGEVTVRVASTRPPNRAPKPADDYARTEAGRSVTLRVLDNDWDPDGDELRLASLGTPANGRVTERSDRSLVYVPDEGFFGRDRFTYVVSDGRKMEEASVTVEVTDF